MGRPVPDPFAELDAPAARRRETRIRDVLVGPVAVGRVLGRADEVPPDGIEQERRDAGVIEQAVDEPEERVALVLGVGVDPGVAAVGARGVAGQAAPALAVLDDDHLAAEPVGMLEDALDDAADEVAVGAAAVFPLGVDLDEHDVGGRDEAVRPVERAGDRGPVELEPVPAHEAEEGVHARMAVARNDGVGRDLGHLENVVPGVRRLIGGGRCLAPDERQRGRADQAQLDEIPSLHGDTVPSRV